MSMDPQIAALAKIKREITKTVALGVTDDDKRLIIQIAERQLAELKAGLDK